MDGKGYYGSGEGNFANMPKDVKMKQWPECPAYLNADLNDDISGIDSDQRSQAGYLRSHKSNIKY